MKYDAGNRYVYEVTHLWVETYEEEYSTLISPGGLLIISRIDEIKTQSYKEFYTDL